MISNIRFDSIKTWIIVISIIIIITLIIGLIFEIPDTQLAASILVSSILVISAFVFQKLASRQRDKKNEL
ncbi:hypothetical protein [Candidatus Nitrosocosmicus franklandus]|uniref:Uncharacterized protein n=1 Tax=Candidatus Nitrosocosmicus franklandianus TaxID=1798806 RepID=A0A484I743_9ARCH|nr:hypothetical protein [Candidatus Nitrosocosmicus franklandus]VFJ12991.1 protein of unknown function [Candidatus Nitrosocosmicus franklandus]